MNTVFLLGMPGGSEILVIAAIVLLLFGGKKIPELMKGLGKGIREFNAAKSNLKEELDEGMKEDTSEKAKSKEESKS